MFEKILALNLGLCREYIMFWNVDKSICLSKSVIIVWNPQHRDGGVSVPFVSPGSSVPVIPVSGPFAPPAIIPWWSHCNCCYYIPIDFMIYACYSQDNTVRIWLHVMLMLPYYHIGSLQLANMKIMITLLCIFLINAQPCEYIAVSHKITDWKHCCTFFIFTFAFHVLSF